MLVCGCLFKQKRLQRLELDKGHECTAIRSAIRLCGIINLAPQMLPSFVRSGRLDQIAWPASSGSTKRKLNPEVMMRGIDFDFTIPLHALRWLSRLYPACALPASSDTFHSSFLQPCIESTRMPYPSHMCLGSCTQRSKLHLRWSCRHRRSDDERLTLHTSAPENVSVRLQDAVSRIESSDSGFFL